MRNGTWQLPYLRKLREQLHEVRVDGCAYGLKNPETGNLLKKEWRIITSDPTLEASLGRLCQNRYVQRNQMHYHEEIEGTTPSACRSQQRLDLVAQRLKPLKHRVHLPVRALNTVDEEKKVHLVID